MCFSALPGPVLLDITQLHGHPQILLQVTACNTQHLDSPACISHFTSAISVLIEISLLSERPQEEESVNADLCVR